MREAAFGPADHRHINIDTIARETNVHAGSFSVHFHSGRSSGMLGSVIGSFIAALAGRRPPDKRNDLVELEKLYRANRLIKVDYPYRPRCRALDVSRSRVFDLIDAGSGQY